MADTNQVTRSLMSAPLPLIIEQLGLSIAKAQSALDANSVKIAKELVETRVEIGGEEYSLLSLGFVPTFYAFTEATVEAKLSFSVSEETKTEIRAGLSVSVPAARLLVVSIASSTHHSASSASPAFTLNQLATTTWFCQVTSVVSARAAADQPAAAINAVVQQASLCMFASPIAPRHTGAGFALSCASKRG